ncbi:rCG28347 [Rattus norvegicus]|uniref:RCG28347 n=1 Tax=Rattus norvegicus TaxID=10116 RepID=A6IDS5_RAT|nr:rCG28347 [Rattus norvegicus]
MGICTVQSSLVSKFTGILLDIPHPTPFQLATESILSERPDQS